MIPTTKAIERWMNKYFGEGMWQWEEDEQEVHIVAKKRKKKEADPNQTTLWEL